MSDYKWLLVKYYYTLGYQPSQITESILVRLIKHGRVPNFLLNKLHNFNDKTYLFFSFESMPSDVDVVELFSMEANDKHEIKVRSFPNLEKFEDCIANLEDKIKKSKVESVKCTLKEENVRLTKRLDEVMDENIMLKRKCELLEDAHRESRLLIADKLISKVEYDRVEKNYRDLLESYKEFLQDMKKKL